MARKQRFKYVYCLKEQEKCEIKLNLRGTCYIFVYVNKWDDVICAVNLCIFKAVNSLEIAILLNRNQRNTFWELLRGFVFNLEKVN